MAEHRKIIKAFKACDEKLAEQMMREHLSSARAYYLAEMEQKTKGSQR